MVKKCIGCSKSLSFEERIFAVTQPIKDDFEKLTLIELQLPPTTQTLMCLFCLRSLQMAIAIKDKFTQNQIDEYMRQQNIVNPEIQENPANAIAVEDASVKLEPIEQLEESTLESSLEDTQLKSGRNEQGRYGCPDPSCNKSYTSLSGRYRHFYQVHKKRRYLCPIENCSALLPRKDNYIYHLNSAHTELEKAEKEIAFNRFKHVQPIFGIDGGENE